MTSELARSPLLANLRKALRHPIVSLFVGLVMLGSGLAELARDIAPDFESKLRLHHGVIILGLVTALRGAIEALEGLQTVGESLDDD